MEESLIGFLIGSVFGVVFGVALGPQPHGVRRLLGLHQGAQRRSRASCWRRSSSCCSASACASKVALSFVMVFFVVFSNAFQGVREADRAMIANAQILGAKPWAVTRSVIIPSAMSWIFASLHISFGFAIVGAIVGEFIGARYGIGFIIQTARGVHDTAEMYAAIVIIVVVVLGAEWLMTLVENRLAKWRPPPVQDHQ